jgi:Holliday junction resolvase RusA-like endonuclease
MTDSSVTVITIPLIPPSLNKSVGFEARNGCLRADHRKFRDDVILLTRGKKAPLLAVRFDVEIRVFIAQRPWNQVPDIDNLPKTLLDALTKAGVFPDDRFISDCTARRRKANGIRDERTVITIRAAVDLVDEIY